MSLRLLAVAQAELDDAIRWYNAQAPGLGEAFVVEAVKSMRLIERHPNAWQALVHDIRRCRMARFPYGIIYHADAEMILVLAIAHLHREPTNWRTRLIGTPR